MDGTPVASWDDWVGYVKRRPGELVDVAVRRDGQRQTFSVTIGTAEQNRFFLQELKSVL